MKGWILDVGADNEKNCMVIWRKGENGSVEKFECVYTPSFYVYSTPESLQVLEHTFEGDPFITSMEYVKKRLWLGEQEKEVLKFSLSDYRALMRLAGEIDEMGDFSVYELFNVDFSLATAFMLEKDIIPMALGTFTDCGGFTLEEDLAAIDYPSPDLSSVELSVAVKAGEIPRLDDPLSKIVLDDTVITGKDEKEKLFHLIEEIRTRDPDIIYTTNGDSFVFPYLSHRAEVNDFADFYLGRERNLVPIGKAKSYFSYGRVIYRPPKCLLNGRIHIDRSTSFLYREGGIHGLTELSRLSRIPLQTLSRVTPGTVITAMQIAQAYREGVLIRWKKNVPEDFKDAKTLLRADRGGMIYDPKIGIHENVVEIDFTSMYPAIMVKHNISPETVLCSCCNESTHRVPVIGYPICEKRVGLIPTVLEPLIARRSEYKRRVKQKKWQARRKEYEARKNVLKWVLVTCFGYTGYRNARFGRIECHEAINAYSRDLLLETAQIAEERGYEILHGIVDSLWLKSTEKGVRDHERLRQAIYKQTSMPLELEGVYKWVVFLSRKSGATGALNRYYGLFTDGSMKIRGLELRRSDTPQLIKDAQMDMLKVMAKANDAAELRELVPEVIDVLKGYVERVMNGECALQDLVYTTVVSKELDFYSQLTNSVACMLQLKRKGVHVRPGEQIKYIVTDAGSKRYGKKVTSWSQVQDDNQLYDKKRYMRAVLRAGESILSPFGFTERTLVDVIRPTQQLTLPV